MPNYFQATLVGHVGKKRDLRFTETGIAVIGFSVAVNNPAKKDAPPCWFDVTAWRQTAEFVNQYVETGAAVIVDADWVELSTWEGQDGQTRASIKVQARRVSFAGGRAQTDAQQDGADGEELPF